MKRAPIYASAADDITARIIWEMLRTAPLLVGISSCPAMNIWPPARLRDLGSDRYDVSLWIARIMLLARKVSTASSCVAMKSKNPLHSAIVLSVGFACWDARELRAVSSPPSTPFARKRNTPQNSWMNSFPALSSAGELSASWAYWVLAP